MASSLLVSPFSVILITIYSVLATIGFFIGRWVINEYDRILQPYNNTNNNTSKHTITSSHALNETDLSSTKQSTESQNIHSSKLQTRLQNYEGPNPFIIKPLSNYERFKIYFFCITCIAPLRLLLFFCNAFICYLIAIPITLCLSPNGFIHTLMVKLIRFWIGCSLFLFGFYFIEFSDSRSLRHKSAQTKDTQPIRVIVANHSTIFDGLVLLWKTKGIIAAKKELSKAPVFGRIMNALQTLWIDRSGQRGRDSAKQQIIDHVNDFSAAPLIIFPQGTCSNISTVTSFKTGAYLAKQPVLEVSLNWSKNEHCDCSFVSDVNVIARIMHIACCQFINYCHIDVYNEHAPNEKEQKDVALFADNSRRMIVKSLNAYNANKCAHIRPTQHSYSDWHLLQKATKNNANLDTSHLLMHDIVSNLQMRTKTVTYLAERFNKLDVNKSGWIEYDEFCSAIDRDPKEDSQQLRDLFNMFLNTENISANRIGFDAFLVGVATCFMDDKIKDAITIMFNANASESCEYIVKENIMYTYEKYVDKAKFNGDEHGYDEWLLRMKVFVDQVFGDSKKLQFDAFYEKIEKNKYQNMVQHYLQSIITVRLKIKLTKHDFVSRHETIYIDPLTELVRSTSIQSVQQLL